MCPCPLLRRYSIYLLYLYKNATNTDANFLLAHREGEEEEKKKKYDKRK